MDVRTFLPTFLSLLSFLVDCSGADDPLKLDILSEQISPLFIKRIQFHFLAKPLNEECFYQPGLEGSHFVLYYQVRDDEGTIRYKEKDPSGKETLTELESRGQRTIKWKEEGDYQFCFTNIRRSILKVHVMLAIIDGNLQRKLYAESTDVPEEYQGLWNATIELASDLNRMYGYMFQGHRRAGSDWQLVQQNRQFVGNWSMAQCCVIIMAGLAQVYALRSMFTTVSVTPTNKPRS